MTDTDGLVRCPHCGEALKYPAWVRGDCCTHELDMEWPSMGDTQEVTP